LKVGNLGEENSAAAIKTEVPCHRRQSGVVTLASEQDIVALLK